MTATLTASQLATPPRPPFPQLDRPLTPAQLEEALRSFHGSYYVQHPFHQLMYSGALTCRQFQGWVANRLAYQRVVPRKDAAILSNCPDPDVRRVWLSRIVDHDGTEPGTGGIELWIRLGVALGVPREEMEDERHVLPAARLICESYVTFCKTKPWVEAVAASLTELFAPKIHQQRIEAFPKHYSWIPPEALDYFRSRLIQAPRDVTHGLSIVQTHCTTVEMQRRAFEALAFKLDMLWALIDVIHNAYREE
jgi:pyrroloquinoline-quinone synthase